MFIILTERNGLVVLNVKSLIESAEKCKNSEINEEFGDIFKIG